MDISDDRDMLLGVAREMSQVPLSDSTVDQSLFLYTRSKRVCKCRSSTLVCLCLVTFAMCQGQGSDTRCWLSSVTRTVKGYCGNLDPQSMAAAITRIYRTMRLNDMSVPHSASVVAVVRDCMYRAF